VVRTPRASGQLRARFEAAVTARLSPERTRRATLLERLTVSRLSWEQLVRLHSYIELLGKLATVVWVGFVASIVLGLDWRGAVNDTLNGGDLIEGALVLAVLVPTLVFVAARSMLASRAGACSASCGAATSSASRRPTAADRRHAAGAARRSIS
jgi:hypothetical protein